MKNVLYIDKPSGMTSFDVCAALRPVFGTRSIGHTGTLDPNATGVMIILLNKATKANQFLVTDRKEYIAEARLGQETDTLDIDGKLIREEEIIPFTEEEAKEVFASFLGTSLQTPPMTSAIKVKGKKLYEYQREGKEVEIPVREITVYALELLSLREDTIRFRAEVSSGTYIRVLMKDILARLNNIGTLTSLCRSRIDDVALSDCDSLEEVRKGNYHLHSLCELLEKRYVTLEIEDDRDVRNGKALSLDCGAERVFLKKGETPLAVCEKREDGKYHSLRGLF